MPGAIDDTLKHLTELSPQDWVIQGGWSSAPAQVIDADIATISGATEGVRAMKESVTYMAIIEEGAQEMLLFQGRHCFGEPSTQVVAALNAVTSVSGLEELGVRLLHVSSWEDLLGLNGPGRRSRGRKKNS
jgi:hypothetical protein